MLSLSVVDDIGALLAIAVFYSDDVSIMPILIAAACVVALALVSRVKVFRGPFYLVVGLILWVAMVESGIHPTLAGVVLGLLVPAYASRAEDVREAGALARAFGQSPLPELARSAKLSVERAVSPNERLTELLHPWSSFFIVPVFALANAGVVINGELLERAFCSTVTWGVIAGLVVGKFVGIGLTSLSRSGWASGKLPGRHPVGRAAGRRGARRHRLHDLAVRRRPRVRRHRAAGRRGAHRHPHRLAARAARRLGRLRVRQVARRGGGGRADHGARPGRRPDPRPHPRPVDAPFELVEYGDFECPFCGRATGAVEELRERFGDQLRYVFRHLPLPEVHPHAELAAEAAEAAAAQGAFWEMHDRLFAHQDALDPGDLVDHAEALGLDVERFSRDPRLGRARRARARRRGERPGQRRRGHAHLLRQRPTPDRPLRRRHAGRGPHGRRPRRRRPSRAGALRERASPPDPAADYAARHPGPPLDLDDLTEQPADATPFPRLTSAQIDTLAAFGERRPITSPASRCSAPAAEAADFVVVVSGAVAMVALRPRHIGRVHGAGQLHRRAGAPARRDDAAHDPGRRAEGEVVIVPAARFTEALAADLELRDIISAPTCCAARSCWRGERRGPRRSRS